MGFRYRKSIQLMPGVRMNISNRGIGYSAGVRGARISRGPSGRVTRTLSIPGTGISHVSTLNSGRPRASGAGPRTAAAAPAAPPAPPKPGMFSPAWEKELYKALVERTPDPDALPAIARAHPDTRLLAAAMEGFLRFQGGQHARARELLAWVFAQRQEVATHPFATRYLAGATITVEIAGGVSAALPVSTSTAALAVAELHQDAGDLDVAIATVESVDPPTIFAALSLAELYTEAGRHAEAVDLTDGVTNTDDATALLCVYRGVALREQGYHEAAREAFKEALRVRSRASGVRHLAWIERAQSYLAQGKNAMARKDLERVLAEDSDAPGLTEALAQLPS